MKERIEFIDLAKGICIFLVVMYHCYINFYSIIFIRMPFYFVLSGIFFKQYSCFLDFLIRRINKNLIPFLFFYLVGFAIVSFLQYFFPNIRISSAVDHFYFTDPLYSRLFFNYPIWFLLSLFSANIIYYVICKLTRNILIQGFLIAILAVIANYLNYKQIILPMYLCKTLYYIPFFFLGTLLKKTNLLYKSKYDKYSMSYLPISFVIFIGLTYVNIDNIILKNILFYIISIIGVIFVILLCKKIKTIPFFSYIGKYSIVILCTHNITISVLKFILGGFINMEILYSKVILLILTMIIETFLIKYCIKYIPYFTAQKDLIKNIA